MWNCDDIQTEVNELLMHYQKLSISKEDATGIHLSGTIDVYRSALDYILQKQYVVEIEVPKALDKLPVVFDKKGAVSSNYAHKYVDGSLCLETDSYIMYRFIDGMNLVAWMDEFVEPYFFSYEFFCRFGKYPFGERPHNAEGIIHTYQDLWHESDPLITFQLLRYAAEEQYRGHLFCPCNSGKRIRNCHGPIMFSYMSDTRRLEILRNDLKNIRKVLIKNK